VSAPVITFLSDYGLADEFVGVCHGVIARRCPDARVIDVCHTIAPQDVRLGALVLRDAVAYMPAAVHLAVVDPGVGASGAAARRAVALRAAREGHLFVGPDNGLLTPAARALGGVVEAVDIGASIEALSPTSATFHGRDIFAPVAAALACGTALAEVGQAVSVESLVEIQFPSAALVDGTLRASVVSIDAFGNVALDATASQLRALGVELGGRVAVQWADGEALALHVRAFADVGIGQLLVYLDARGMVALAVNGSSAARTLRLERGEQLTLRAAA
jgi:S-adenosylmethionine hydrolase